MRCKACNANLDDLESTNKDVVSGEYLDLCRECLIASNIICELTLEYVDEACIVYLDEYMDDEEEQ